MRVRYSLDHREILWCEYNAVSSEYCSFTRVHWFTPILYTLQNRGSGVKRSTRNVLPPNTKTLRAEDLAFGSMLYLIKKYPSPRFRANPFIKIDVATGDVIIDKDVLKTVDKLDVMLTHKFEDKDIVNDELIGEIDKD